MKKVTIAALIIGAFILYSLLYTRASSIALSPNNVNDSRSSSSAVSTPSTAGTPADPGATATATKGSSGSQYKDGAYVGSIADAQWGNIQVKAIIQNGKITDVQFLQYPNERDRSVFINQNADPQLTSEAIQAQSANVDIVTGATDSSEAFIQSLSDALSQAKA